MYRIQWTKTAVRAGATAILLAGTSVWAPAQQTAAESSPVEFSSSEFQQLRWLEGDWRGLMPSGAAFYERYALVDDSTFSIEAFADSALSSPEDIGRLILRSGIVYREEASGERAPATQNGESSIRFGEPDRGFTWARRADGSWTATIHREDRSGVRRDVHYLLERYRAPAAHEAVRAAVLDYVDALYEVDPSRIERSVHPELAKRGFFWRRAADAYEEFKMNYSELHSLAGSWNSNGRVDPNTAIKEIVLFEVLDRTATAKLVADWGIDYLHLAKYDGEWKIVNVLWQSHPQAPRGN